MATMEDPSLTNKANMDESGNNNNIDDVSTVEPSSVNNNDNDQTSAIEDTDENRNNDIIPPIPVDGLDGDRNDSSVQPISLSLDMPTVSRNEEVNEAKLPAQQGDNSPSKSTQDKPDPLQDVAKQVDTGANVGETEGKEIGLIEAHADKGAGYVAENSSGEANDQGSMAETPSKKRKLSGEVDAAEGTKKSRKDDELSTSTPDKPMQDTSLGKKESDQKKENESGSHGADKNKGKDSGMHVLDKEKEKGKGTDGLDPEKEKSADKEKGNNAIIEQEKEKEEPPKNLSPIEVLEKENLELRAKIADMEKELASLRKLPRENLNLRRQVDRLKNIQNKLKKATAVKSEVDDAEAGKLGKYAQFSFKLMELLNKNEHPEAMWWTKEGKAFILHREKFSDMVLPMEFDGISYRSWLRRIGRWGFERRPGEPGKVGKATMLVEFEHKMFQRDSPNLLKQWGHGFGREKFPTKLGRVMAENLDSNAIYWHNNGQNVAVDTEKFTKTLLKTDFDNMKFDSFVQMVKRWGFKKIDEDKEKNLLFFHHDKFIKDVPLPPLILEDWTKVDSKEPATPKEAWQKKNGDNFPTKIYAILRNKKAKDAIWWVDDGNKFAIDQEKFQEFSGILIPSFRRSFHRWGFQKIRNEDEYDDTAIFEHPLFKRKKPQLLKQLTKPVYTPGKPRPKPPGWLQKYQEKNPTKPTASAEK